MAQQNINIGSSANKGDGDPLRTAFDKINDNFTELYGTVIGDSKGSVFGDDSTLLVDAVNSTIPAINLSGALPALDGSALTGITSTTLGGQNASYYLDYNNFTNTPTTLAGYGITDATSNNNPTFTGAVDFTGATSIDFNTATINNLEFADISSTPTTLAGYGITDSVALTGLSVTQASANGRGTLTYDNTTGVFTYTPPDMYNILALDTISTDIGSAVINEFSTDGTLAGNSDTALPTEKAVKTYVDANSGGGGAETDPIVGAITGIVKADGAGNISAAVAGTDYSTFDGAFGSLTGTPTTLAGYGITDATSNNNPAFTGAVDFTGATSIDFNTVTINNLEFSDISTTPTTLAGYGITDGFDGDYGSLSNTPTLFSGVFADLSSKPTTLAGYGITDALTAGGALTGSSLEAVAVGAGVADGNDLIITGGDATELNSTGGDANITGGSGALASGNVNIGASQTALVTIGSGSNNVDFPNGTAVDFTGATVTALDSSGLTKPIELDDSEEVRFGTDNDMQIYHSGVTGVIKNTTGTLVLQGGTVRIQDGGLAQSAFSASNGIATLYHLNTAVLNTTAGGIQIEKGVEEKFATTDGATGVTALDCSTGHVHYLTAPAGDITANFTNLNLTAEYATNVTVIIDQGGTEYEITAVQIGGVAQTIVWQGNSAPTGTANGVDSFSFTILNDAGTYVVLGQMVAFGGV